MRTLEAAPSEEVLVLMVENITFTSIASQNNLASAMSFDPGDLVSAGKEENV